MALKDELKREIEVKVEFMPFVIGKGGEEINRIRAETGAAIDAERDPGSRFKLRGSKEAVGAAMAALTEAIERNTRVGEHAPLPDDAAGAASALAPSRPLARQRAQGSSSSAARRRLRIAFVALPAGAPGPIHSGLLHATRKPRLRLPQAMSK